MRKLTIILLISFLAIIILASSVLSVNSNLQASVRVLLQGDVDGNCKVDIFDLAIVGLCYGQSAIGECSSADLNNDNKINIFDLATVGINYGKTC